MEEGGAEDDDDNMDGLQTDGEEEDGDESEKEMGEDGDGANNSSFQKMGAQVCLHFIHCFESELSENENAPCFSYKVLFVIIEMNLP